MSNISLFTTIAGSSVSSLNYFESPAILIAASISYVFCVIFILSHGNLLKLRSQSILYKILVAITVVLSIFLYSALFLKLTSNTREDFFIQNIEKPRSEVYAVDSVKLATYSDDSDILKANSISFNFGCFDANRAVYLKSCDSFYVKDLPARALSLTETLYFTSQDGYSKTEYDRDRLSLNQGSDLAKSVTSGIVPFKTANEFVLSTADNTKNLYYNYILSYYKEDSSFSSLKAFTNLVSGLATGCLDLPRPICNDFKKAYIAKVAEYGKKQPEGLNLDALFEESLDYGAKL